MVIRNDVRCCVSVLDLNEADLVMCADGRFKPATDILSLQAFLSHARWVRERVAAQERPGWFAILLFFVLAFLLFADFYDPPPKSILRWRPRNDEPLSSDTRALVRERDTEICTYCGRHDPKGHVDHRVSRVNGGSNRLHNLSWACRSCNWKKGPRNARQYMRQTAAS